MGGIKREGGARYLDPPLERYQFYQFCSHERLAARHDFSEGWGLPPEPVPNFRVGEGLPEDEIYLTGG